MSPVGVVLGRTGGLSGPVTERALGFLLGRAPWQIATACGSPRLLHPLSMPRRLRSPSCSPPATSGEPGGSPQQQRLPTGVPS